MPNQRGKLLLTLGQATIPYDPLKLLLCVLALKLISLAMYKNAMQISINILNI
eukprot:c44072_g1_i1 orf=287-445(+)